MLCSYKIQNINYEKIFCILIGTEICLLGATFLLGFILSVQYFYAAPLDISIYCLFSSLLILKCVLGIKIRAIRAVGQKKNNWIYVELTITGMFLVGILIGIVPMIKGFFEDGREDQLILCIVLILGLNIYVFKFIICLKTGEKIEEKKFERDVP
nr:uncharacterized protein LOC121121557 [Lepeophtheirus salmonis]